MTPLNLSLTLLGSYVVFTLLCIALGQASWENPNQVSIFIVQLSVTLFLIAIYEPLLILFNVQPTPMDKTLADADQTDFYEI